MEITRKIFWNQAMKGGTIIGLVIGAFKVLGSISEGAGWLNTISLILFILLLYGFTKRTAVMSDPAQGFPYSRCMGFTIAMMLFAGIIIGVIQTLINNLIDPESLASTVNEAAAILDATGIYTDEYLDTFTDQALRSMKNPLYIVFASIFTYVLQGGVIGLFTSALAQRKPNPFAVSHNEENNSEEHDGE